MISREELSAHLYAINYVKPCFKKDTAFYLTPKQAFKAAAYLKHHQTVTRTKE